MVADSEPVEVSFVIPCLDEAETIATVVGTALGVFASNNLRGEVVVADNGSTDGSRELARDAGARVIDASAVRGFGAASIAGATAARGRWLLFADADGEHDLSEASKLLDVLAEHDALVVGSRHVGTYAKGAGSRINRWIGTPALTFVLNRFIGTNVTDCNSGFRGIARDTFMGLGVRSSGFEQTTEFIVRAGLLDLPIIEVPITQQPAPAGRQPHLRRFRDGWRHLKFVLLHAPDRVLLRPGVLALVLGLLFFVPQVGGRIEWGPVVMDIHLMILGGLLLNIGVQMVGSAVVCATIAGEPVAPPGQLSRRLGRHFELDRMLPWAGALFALGLAADLGVVWISARQNFVLMEPRLALIGTTGMGIAIQLGVLSFVHSIVESYRPLP